MYARTEKTHAGSPEEFTKQQGQSGVTITGMLLGAWMAFRRIFQSMRDLEEEPSEKPEDDLHKKQEQAGMENNNQHSE